MESDAPLPPLPSTHLRLAPLTPILPSFHTHKKKKQKKSRRVTETKRGGSFKTLWFKSLVSGSYGDDMRDCGVRGRWEGGYGKSGGGVSSSSSSTQRHSNNLAVWAWEFTRCVFLALESAKLFRPTFVAYRWSLCFSLLYRESIMIVDGSILLLHVCSSSCRSSELFLL